MTNATSHREELAAQLAMAIDYAHNNENGDITHAELALTELLDEFSEDAVLDYVDNHHLTFDAADEWADNFRDQYIGMMSARDYAEDLFNDLNEVPSYLQNYIDYEKLGRDMIMGGDIWESDGGFLFRSL